MEVAGHAFLGDEQRQRLEVLDLGDLGIRLRQHHLRILLENRGDGDDGNVVGDGVERHQRVRGHEEIDLAGDQQHPVVLVRAAGDDGDVEAVFLVGAVGDRLEEAAMLGLGDPVGAEGDLVERLGARRRKRGESGQQARN
ncbi:hypothetical protein ABIA45_005167 [Bradyrhizobium sp. USDA 336]